MGTTSGLHWYLSEETKLRMSKAKKGIHFSDEHKKQIIELFGNYWHKEEDICLREKIYAQYGYNTLVIWEKELKYQNKVLDKITKFTNMTYSSGGNKNG